MRIRFRTGHSEEVTEALAAIATEYARVILGMLNTVTLTGLAKNTCPYGSVSGPMACSSYNSIH